MSGRYRAVIQGERYEQRLKAWGQTFILLNRIHFSRNGDQCRGEMVSFSWDHLAGDGKVDRMPSDFHIMVLHWRPFNSERWCRWTWLPACQTYQDGTMTSRTETLEIVPSPFWERMIETQRFRCQYRTISLPMETLFEWENIHLKR